VYRAKDVASGTAVALKQCLLPADAPGADAAARREVGRCSVREIEALPRV
jgi:hypothetical protein